jgi:hypothetical protein
MLRFVPFLAPKIYMEKSFEVKTILHFLFIFLGSPIYRAEIRDSEIVVIL